MKFCFRKSAPLNKLTMHHCNICFPAAHYGYGPPKPIVLIDPWKCLLLGKKGIFLHLLKLFHKTSFGVFCVILGCCHCWAWQTKNVFVRVLSPQLLPLFCCSFWKGNFGIELLKIITKALKYKHQLVKDLLL